MLIVTQKEKADWSKHVFMAICHAMQSSYYCFIMSAYREGKVATATTCIVLRVWWRNEGTWGRDDHRWRTRFNCVQTAMKLHHWPAHWRCVSRCLSFSHWPTAIHDPCIVCHIASSNGFVEHSIKDASAVCVRVCFVFRAAYFLLALHCCRLFGDFCFNDLIVESK